MSGCYYTVVSRRLAAGGEGATERGRTGVSVARADKNDGQGRVWGGGCIYAHGDGEINSIPSRTSAAYMYLVLRC